MANQVGGVRPRPHERTQRYEAGVHIQADGYGGFCATIYLRVSGDLTDDEAFAHPVLRMEAESTFALAAENAHDWARENVPRDFDIRPELLDVNLMKTPIFV